MKMQSINGVPSQYDASSVCTVPGITVSRQPGNGEQVVGFPVTLGKIQSGNDEHTGPPSVVKGPERRQSGKGWQDI